jgi:hypothetical protein
MSVKQSVQGLSPRQSATVDMFLLPKIFGRADETPVSEASLESAAAGNEKNVTDDKTATGATMARMDSSDDSSIEAQAGVIKMEAISHVWSRNHIIVAWIL